MPVEERVRGTYVVLRKRAPVEGLMHEGGMIFTSKMSNLSPVGTQNNLERIMCLCLSDGLST